MLEFKTQIRVRRVETDAIIGIAHHRNYIDWLELARVELMNTLGFPYREIEKQGALMVVLGVNIQFLSSSFFDDRLVIKLFMKEKPKIRIKIEYQIMKEDTIIATAETLHAFINKEGKTIRPPISFLECIKPYFNNREF